MRIGIYGGSFSPPHRGHTESVRSVSARLNLDRLIVIPSGSPPHKQLPDNSPSAVQRYEMAKIAFSHIPNAEVSDIEIRRSGESYTIDTISELQKQYPSDELFLIMGTDMFLTLREWRDSEELLTRVTPVVTMRRDDALEDTSAEASLLALTGVRSVVMQNDVIDISSTELRELLPRRKKPWHIDDGVYSYIIENGLYSAKPDFDWLRLRAYHMLDTKRIRHVAGCEETAVRLAERWGADTDMAREAAILHDITKRLEHEEHLLACDEYGAEVDEAERASAKLLHSKTGAAIASKRFCVCDEVKNAIMWHTTGRENMPLLEKVIYLADYIEPNRAFEGVEELRALAFSDIDKALIMGMEMSIDDLVSRGISPHRNTTEAVEFLKERVYRGNEINRK